MRKDGETPFIYSPKGCLLALSSALDPRPVLTVELSGKWYSLFLIHDDRTVEGVTFAELSDIWDDPQLHPSFRRSGAAYVDHVPNPYAVAKLADSRAWHLDELAYELIWGRWMLEVLDFDLKYTSG